MLTPQCRDKFLGKSPRDWSVRARNHMLWFSEAITNSQKANGNRIVMLCWSRFDRTLQLVATSGYFSRTVWNKNQHPVLRFAGRQPRRSCQFQNHFVGLYFKTRCQRRPIRMQDFGKAMARLRPKDTFLITVDSCLSGPHIRNIRQSNESRNSFRAIIRFYCLIEFFS